MSDKFDREPKPSTLEMCTEWQGEEGLVIAQFSPLGDGIQVDVETIHGKTMLYADDVNTLHARLHRYMTALKQVREAV